MGKVQDGEQVEKDVIGSLTVAPRPIDFVVVAKPPSPAVTKTMENTIKLRQEIAKANLARWIQGFEAVVPSKGAPERNPTRFLPMQNLNIKRTAVQTRNRLSSNNATINNPQI